MLKIGFDKCTLFGFTSVLSASVIKPQDKEPSDIRSLIKHCIFLNLCCLCQVLCLCLIMYFRLLYLFFTAEMLKIGFDKCTLFGFTSVLSASVIKPQDKEPSDIRSLIKHCIFLNLCCLCQVLCLCLIMYFRLLYLFFTAEMLKIGFDKCTLFGFTSVLSASVIKPQDKEPSDIRSLIKHCIFLNLCCLCQVLCLCLIMYFRLLYLFFTAEMLKIGFDKCTLFGFTSVLSASVIKPQDKEPSDIRSLIKHCIFLNLCCLCQVLCLCLIMYFRLLYLFFIV